MFQKCNKRAAEAAELKSEPIRNHPSVIPERWCFWLRNCHHLRAAASRYTASTDIIFCMHTEYVDSSRIWIAACYLNGHGEHAAIHIQLLSISIYINQSINLSIYIYIDR